MKKDLLRIYSLIFIGFMFVSSVKFMFELLNKLPFISEKANGILMVAIIVLHIGSGLLILSGKLKD